MAVELVSVPPLEELEELPTATHPAARSAARYAALREELELLPDAPLETALLVALLHQSRAQTAALTAIAQALEGLAGIGDKLATGGGLMGLLSGLGR